MAWLKMIALVCVLIAGTFAMTTQTRPFPKIPRAPNRVLEMSRNNERSILYSNDDELYNVRYTVCKSTRVIVVPIEFVLLKPHRGRPVMPRYRFRYLYDTIRVWPQWFDGKCVSRLMQIAYPEGYIYTD